MQCVADSLSRKVACYDFGCGWREGREPKAEHSGKPASRVRPPSLQHQHKLLVHDRLTITSLNRVRVDAVWIVWIIALGHVCCLGPILYLQSTLYPR